MGLGLLKRDGRSFVLLIQPKMGCYDPELCEKIEVFVPREEMPGTISCEAKS